MWRTCHGSRIERHDKADARGGEIHIAQAGDGGLYRAAEDVECEHIADLETDFFGFFSGEADLRRTICPKRPMLAFNNAPVFGEHVIIGDAAVALDDPMPGRDLCGGDTIDLGEDAAQHGRCFDTADRRVIFELGFKWADLIFLNIDEEKRRRNFRKIAGDGATQIAIDLANC